MGIKVWKFLNRKKQDNSPSHTTSPDPHPEPCPIHNNGLPIREDNRYRASSLLASHGIPNVVWLEDLLALHGCDTMVWDLNLLVPNPHAAAACLLELGYHLTSPEARFQHDPAFSKSSVRVKRTPPSTETGVVLLPAGDWYYAIQNQNPQNPLPPLHSFLDSVMEFWLNISSEDYIDRLESALYVAALIGYCYVLPNDDKDATLAKVKTIEYGQKLKPEHRELHYDIVAGKESFTHTARHRYHAQKYREIRAGLFIPRPPGERRGHRAQLGGVPEEEDEVP
jgi:hypothetical protein